MRETIESPVQTTFDPLRIVAALRSHGVSYVLVGGLAAAAWGSPNETDDIDICLTAHEGNLERLGLALMDLGAVRRNEGGGEHRVSFRTNAGQLDVFELTGGYADIHGRSSQVDLGRGLLVHVASVDDLVRLKRASGDLAGAAHLDSLGHPFAPYADDERTAEDRPAEPDKVRGQKIWKLLEDVDHFLSDLDHGRVRNNHKRTRS
jgi:hypothetical protein